MNQYYHLDWVCPDYKTIWSVSNRTIYKSNFLITRYVQDGFGNSLWHPLSELFTQPIPIKDAQINEKTS